MCRSEGNTRKKTQAATEWPSGKERVMEIENVGTRSDSVENFRRRLKESCKILLAFVIECQYFMNYKFGIYDTLTNSWWLLRIAYLVDNSAKKFNTFDHSTEEIRQFLSKRYFSSLLLELES